MDAVKYLREITRMCTKYETCEGCQIGHEGRKIMEVQEPEKIVAIVEKWAKEHPVETRQSRLLKEFPNVIRTAERVIGICPKYVDTGAKCAEQRRCDECKVEYWSEEIEDEGN